MKRTLNRWLVPLTLAALVVGCGGGGGGNADTGDTTDRTVPNAPSGLSASAASSAQIDLAWTDGASNEDAFQLERSADGVTFTLIATLPANTAAHADVGLAALTKYYYRVRALNANGESTYSNVADATTQAPPGCTGLCLQQVTCPGSNVTTTLTGKVYAPNGVDPLPNVLVYIPNGTVQPFAPGAACETCSGSVSGSPLVTATTDTAGSFTLENAPVGANIPLVIQTGRWRRQVTVDVVAACQDNAVSPSLSRLPKNRGEGDIPLMAFATGQADALECVLRKIGVDDAEFTNPSDNGRIHLYVGDGVGGIYNPTLPLGGAGVDNMTPSETTLVSSLANMQKYDMLFFPNKGDRKGRTTTELQNFVNYANAGGRAFATRFSYVWLYSHPPFSSTAIWNVDQPAPSNQIGYIDTTFAGGQQLAAWLEGVGASSTLGEISLSNVKHNMDGLIAPSQQWLYFSNPSQVIQYTFETPVGAQPAQQCGRVLFNEYLSAAPEGGTAAGKFFPSECTVGPMTAEEKLVEYMIFELGSCVAP